MANKVRLIDVTKCMGCKGCQVACKQWNQLPATQTTFTGSYENPADFAPETWGRVKFNEYEQGSEVKWYFNFSSCMHCTEAACVEICPVKAISKTALGTVKIDQGVCIGCGACASVCPFKVPKVGNGKAWKCTSCIDRVTNGMATACATACAPGAITFGDVGDKIAEAEARVSELKSKGYANAQVYGVEELGGLGVIYVLADSPDKYGMPVNPQVAYANVYLWKVALGPVKTLATIGLAAGALSGWFKLRKDEVSKENGERV
ncbi:MAG: 4Fe-4S dicluster domain-containing protein [Bacillota bacterium]|nr:4Fe-4S dicluster domain-containing protein [Bacillota bacterium]